MYMYILVAVYMYITIHTCTCNMRVHVLKASCRCYVRRTCNTPTPSHPSAANEAWYWQKCVLGDFPLGLRDIWLFTAKGVVVRKSCHLRYTMYGCLPL